MGRCRAAAGLATAVAMAVALPAAAAPGDAARRARTDVLIAGIAGGGPGCSLAVARGAGVVYARGAGTADLSTGAPITPDTMFDIGSVSKQFTATAVLMLVRDGRLRLTDRVRALVPQLPEVVATVTVDDLLHQRSGLPDYIDLLQQQGIDPRERSTPGQALAALARVRRLHAAPGTRFDYSNSNYFLLSLVVRRASGVPLVTFLRDRYFAPLGLRAVMDPLGRVTPRARSYDVTATGPQPDDSLWEQTGDGAVWTTPTQLVRFAREYWAPRVGGRALLAARLRGAVDAGDGDRYGAGIYRTVFDDGTVELSHSGAWSSFTTGFAVLPGARVAAAASCNGTGRVALDPEDLADRALDIWG